MDNWMYNVISNGIGGTHLGGTNSVTYRTTVGDIKDSLSVLAFASHKQNRSRAIKDGYLKAKRRYSKEEIDTKMQTTERNIARKLELEQEIITIMIEAGIKPDKKFDSIIRKDIFVAPSATVLLSLKGLSDDAKSKCITIRKRMAKLHTLSRESLETKFDYEVTDIGKKFFLKYRINDCYIYPTKEDIEEMEMIQKKVG